MKTYKELLAALLEGIEKHDTGSLKNILNGRRFLFYWEITPGWPLLHSALRSGCADLELVRAYLESGGDPNRKTDGGVSLLFLAHQILHGEPICTLLRDHGSVMSDWEKMSVALEREADEEKRIKFVQTLVETNPDLIHYSGHRGFTLLHRVVTSLPCSVVQWLVEKGADVNAVSHSGITPLGHLVEPLSEEHKRIQMFLREKGARYSQMEEIRELIYAGRQDAVIEIIEAHPNLLNAWDPFSERPLIQIAASGGAEELVRYLLDRGVDVNSSTKEGSTVLHEAVFTSDANMSLIRLLIERGADVNAKDKSGFTPLHVGGPGDEALAIFLLDHGADINAKTDESDTILDFVYGSKYPGYRKFGNLLKERGAVFGRK